MNDKQGKLKSKEDNPKVNKQRDLKFKSFANLKLTRFPDISKLESFSQLSFSNNPIKSFVSLPSLQKLTNLELDNLKIVSFEGANPQPSLIKISLKNTPLETYKFFIPMVLIVFGMQISFVNGVPISSSNYRIASIAPEIIRPLLVSGWLLTSVNPIRFIHSKTKKHKTIFLQKSPIVQSPSNSNYDMDSSSRVDDLLDQEAADNFFLELLKTSHKWNSFPYISHEINVEPFDYITELSKAEAGLISLRRDHKVLPMAPKSPTSNEKTHDEEEAINKSKEEFLQTICNFDGNKILENSRMFSILHEIQSDDLQLTSDSPPNYAKTFEEFHIKHSKDSLIGSNEHFFFSTNAILANTKLPSESLEKASMDSSASMDSNENITLSSLRTKPKINNPNDNLSISEYLDENLSNFSNS